MNKTSFLVLLFISILPAHLFSQQNKLIGKTAFNSQYPQFFHFRGEMKRDVHTDYDTWEKKYVTSSGLLRKYICEELKIDTILYSWLNRFAETYPEKLLLLHFNGEARQVNDYPEINKKYFPGHWVYETGSLLSEDCTSSQTHIIHHWFNPDNGILKKLDGIAFDVNYFDVSKHESWDTNNDGQADGGWINGQNIWQAGDLQFLKNLRKRMGQNFIITCDGQHPINQQAVGVLNGIESEGLVQHNDGWRGFSRTVNTHLYWDKFNPLSPQFRYVVLKLMDGNDQHHAERLRRFGVATASCLGAYTTVPDSYSFLPSWIQPCSFGRIQGELIRYAKSSPNLLSGTPAELLHKGILKGENCCMSIQGNSIIIKPATQSSTLSIKNVELPTGDITIFIEAETITPPDANSDLVPRFIYASLSNLPDYEPEKKTKEFFTDLYGLVGHEKNENSFYFRRPKVSAGKQTLTITIKGTEQLQIHSIKIYNRPDIIIRQFENAVVCVNPSLEEQEIHLSDFITEYSEKLKIAPIDAVFIPKSKNK